MTQVKRATGQHGMAWWERLVFERPREEFTACPTCSTVYDSVDVVCTADNAALVGTQMADSRKTAIVNAVRIVAVAVALAVGYLNWTWPTYVFGAFIVISFFGLFLRNHSMSRRFFLVISSLGFIAYGVWSTFAPEDVPLLHVTAVLLAGLFVLELPFLVAYTLRTGDNDPRREWMLSNGVDLQIGTLTWIAVMLTLSVLCGLGFIARWLGALFGLALLQVVDLGSLWARLAWATLGAGAVAALVSSTVHSLRGEPFSVADRWTPREILGEQPFRTLPPVPLPTSTASTARFAYMVRRAVVLSANTLIQEVENAYNNLAVRFVNGLAESAVRIANYLRRAAISTALHTIRSLRRFVALSRWCAGWAVHAGIRYVKVFVLPVMACFTGSTLIYAIGEDFSAYVHGGSPLIPLGLVAKGVAAIILFTVGSGLLLRINLGSYFNKMLNALSTFGVPAFLNFLLSAWLLGVVGMITHGPYRIGWVTILSTLLVGAVFVLTQRRTPNKKSDVQP